MKRSKTLKFYGLTKFGKRRVKKRRINKSLLENIENSQRNYLEPLTNIEPSYIEFAKFDQVNWLNQRIVDLEVQVKPLIFLDSSLIIQMLLNFEANGKKFLSEFTEQISDQFEFVCLPGVLFDLEKAGYTEFVRELLKGIINLPKLLEIENFIINYQDKLDEYGFSNLNVGILSDSVYWNFYIQFHVSVAKFLNADTILIASDLKKHYLNKSCYNGKFSFFVGTEIKPTSLKCITAKKFWKKFKFEKQKNESGNLSNFVVNSNFKEWEVPECLGEILKELDRKLIKDVNTFWLDIFRMSESQAENDNYFKGFVDLINKFKDNANILKTIPQFSSLIDKNMHSRAYFSDIKDYTRKIKRIFTFLIGVNKSKSFIHSNELYLTILLFKSNVSNFLRDKFYLKAKFKSPVLPTSINFDLLYKDGNNQQELSSTIHTRYRSNTLQKIIVKNKGTNKSSIRFEPNLQYNDEFINQLFSKFLFTKYCFHKNELKAVYQDFIRFIKAKKEYRVIAKGFSFNRFESLILNTQERNFILLEPHGIYYSKLLENFLLFVQTYHRVYDNSLSLELSAKTLNIKKKELEILIYFLIQNGHMFREKLVQNPNYSIFLQALKKLNNKSTELSQAKKYNPFWFPEKTSKKALSQPELWVENESEALDNTPIYYVDKENRVSYSNRLFNVEIKGETFAADVDTGAFKSLMSNDIAERLFPKQKRYITYVSGYTQHTKRVDMIKDIPFHYNGQQFTDDFLIEENLEKIFKSEVVIGREGYNKMLVRYYGKTLDKLFLARDSVIEDSRLESKIRTGKVLMVSSDVLSLRKEVEHNLNLFLKKLDNTQKQKNIIISKSLKVLEEIISRVNNAEFNIYKNSNPKIITAAIIYAVATSDDKIPIITMKKLEEITSESHSAISSYYYRHIKHIIPRVEFHFDRGFKKMKNRISIYFMEELKKNIDIKTSSLVLELEEKILDDKKLIIELTENDIRLLRSMVINHKDSFNKYFSDLSDVIKNLISISRVYNKIGSKISIKNFAISLYKNGINLLHTSDSFYNTLLEIFDFLKFQYPKLLPNRFKRNFRDEYSRSEYRMIVGNRIKLHIIKHLYNGLYLIDGRIVCPKCYKEGLRINTNETRIKSLEFHHHNQNKEYKFTSRNLYNKFMKDKLNSHILKDLIHQMEIEGLEVLCSVHHSLEHSYIYRYFRKLINWDCIPKNFTQELLSLPGEIVHIIIWIVIENYFKDENILQADLHSVRYSIIKCLKKKYIIEHIFGNFCPTCLEFNTFDHLVSFDFHHSEKPRFDENPYLHEKHRGKIRTVSELFGKDYSCSEIVKILEFEKGGYLCKNCHSVIQYTPKEQLLDVIYDNQHIAKNVLEDYSNVKNKFKLLKDTGIVRDPLIKTLDISETLLKYIDAFYDISQDSKDITIQKLMTNLELSVGAVSAFIRRNWAFINSFLNVKYKDPKSFTSFKNIYILTEEGKNYIELIRFIRGNFKIFFK